MGADDGEIGIFGRVRRWMFGTRSQESLTEAEQAQQGVQRLSLISVWVPIGLCALAAVVTLFVDATLPFVRLVSLGTAALAVGCFFGLLFGTPRVNDVAPRVNADAPAGENSADGKAAADSTLAANNNFYKIADWVTSAIVGIALVELKNFASFFWRVLQRVIGAGDVMQIAITAGLIIALFFAGFIWTFLNARVILMRAFRFADQAEVMKAFANADIAVSQVRKLDSSVDALKQQAIKFDQLWASDPNKGRFGGASASNGRTLKVAGVEADADQPFVKVRLSVSADEGAAPLASPVTFYFHPTVLPKMQTVTPHDNAATCEVTLLEAFTIGATCEDGKTQLELDLETVPEIPARFKTTEGH